MDERFVAYEKKMNSACDVLTRDLSGLRAGRASTTLLDPIKVDAYGQLMPLAQVGTISAPEPRMLTVSVWDKSMVKLVEKAISQSSLGVTPVADGQLVRVMLPDLNEERRNELSKLASKYAEDAKIAVRNIRRDGNEMVKKLEKDKEISEDDSRRLSDEMQKLTDQFIKKIDEMLRVKQKDIMTV